MAEGRRLRDPLLFQRTIYARHFTYRTFGARVGCSDSMISQLVTGAVKSLSPELAADIAEALRVDEALLFEPAVTHGGGRRRKHRGTLGKEADDEDKVCAA